MSGFLPRRRGLRGKTVAGLRSALADFLAFLAAAGRAPQGLAPLPPHRHLRHESEPHLWTAEEIRRLLAVIDRQSAVGKRDYAMILLTARLGLRISDLRQLELGDLDWRAKALTVVQRKTGLPLSLPLLDDVGWAVIDYVRHGRPETACAKVFVKHRHPFGPFGCSSSVGTRLSHYAARARIEFPPGQACGMHSLRGALAVAMIGNGAPMPVVSAVLGHASTDTTQAYYLRFDVERLRCCALDVEDVLGQAGGARAVPEATLQGLADGLAASRHAGGYRFKVPERVLRQFAGYCQREGYPDASITKEAVDGFLYGRHLRASTVRRNELVLRQLAEYAQAAGWRPTSRPRQPRSASATSPRTCSPTRRCAACSPRSTPSRCPATPTRRSSTRSCSGCSTAPG